MKQIPYDQHVLERMAPGALCAEGFLGDDHRDLSEILAEDDSAAVAAGASHEQLAAMLDDWMHRAIAELGRPVKLSSDITATWHEGMGRIPSPWPGEGVYPKGELELTNARTGRTQFITPLSVHLIATHGFYQGRGSRYRIEPTELIAALPTE
ncbi:MAG: hypothetical protein ACYSWU_18835 [Planctomycetota bacterium]|jgi:hypothetical protein